MVISPYPATERARSTFSPFSPTYTFSPVLAVFAVPAGHFTISRRPNVPVPRFSLFSPTCTFSPVLAVFAVSAGDFSVSRRPNVPVPRFLRLARFRPFCPFWPFLLFRLVISAYPGDRTCPFHVFSVFPDLHVFDRFARFGRFCCFGW